MIAEDLNAEERLFISFLHLDETLRASVREREIHEVQPERFMRVAARHGWIPVALNRMEKEPPGSVLTPAHRAWREVFRNHVPHAMRMAGFLQTLTGTLRAAGIPVAAFKGPALAHLAYGDIALRTFQDLDIMIRSRDFLRVYEMLTRESGFSPMRKMKVKELAAWARSGREFMFFQKHVIVDLHMRITEGPNRFRSDRIMESDLIEISLLNRSVPVFDTEAHFLMLALHGSKHGWPELRMVADAAHLAHAQGLDMHRLDALANRYGCRRAVDLALWLSSEICGLKCEGFLTGHGGKTPMGRVVAMGREIAPRIRKGTSFPDKGRRLGMMMTLLDTLSARISFFWHTTTAPKYTDLKESRISSPALQRIMRPLRLVRRRVGRGRRGKGQG